MDKAFPADEVDVNKSSWAISFSTTHCVNCVIQEQCSALPGKGSSVMLS